MNKKVKKLSRVAKAQGALRNQAAAQVAKLDAELRVLESNLAKAEESTSESNIGAMFTSFYIQHLHKLVAEQLKVATRLDLAKQAHILEENKNRKMQRSVMQERSAVERHASELELFETLSS